MATSAATGREKPAGIDVGTRMSATGLLRAFQTQAAAPATSTATSTRGNVPISTPATAGAKGYATRGRKRLTSANHCQNRALLGTPCGLRQLGTQLGLGHESQLVDGSFDVGGIEPVLPALAPPQTTLS